MYVGNGVFVVVNFDMLLQLAVLVPVFDFNEVLRAGGGVGDRESKYNFFSFFMQLEEIWTSCFQS